jgi:hypothetical protein
MRRFLVAAALCLSILAALGAQEGAEPGRHTSDGVRFEAVDVFIDTGDRPLAAYQFELKACVGHAKIVGIEGGEHQAFRSPPYYDPAALQNDRVIIADFDLGEDLPSGRSRVARIHLQVTGEEEPRYIAILQVAAAPAGQRISASIALKERGR